MPIRPHIEGLLLAVMLTPKASKNELMQLKTTSDGKTWLKASVTAIPDKGKANTALIKLLSKKLRLPKTNIQLIAGKQSRLKTVLIVGETALLHTKLKEQLAALDTSD